MTRAFASRLIECIPHMSSATLSWLGCDDAASANLCNSALLLPYLINTFDVPPATVGNLMHTMHGGFERLCSDPMRRGRL